MPPGNDLEKIIIGGRAIPAADAPQSSVICLEVPRDCAYTYFAFFLAITFSQEILRGKKVSSQLKSYRGAFMKAFSSSVDLRPSK